MCLCFSGVVDDSAKDGPYGGDAQVFGATSALIA